MLSGIFDVLQRPHLKGPPRRGYKPGYAWLDFPRRLGQPVFRPPMRAWREPVRGVAWFDDWRRTTPQCRRGRRSNAE